MSPSDSRLPDVRRTNPGTPEAAERKREIVDMRRRGFTFAEIGEKLGITRQSAHDAYWKALAEIPAQSVEAHRREQVERLDWLVAEARAVLERKHLTVQNGRVVTVEGEPVEDDGPVLEAARTILQIEKLRAELLGTPAPQQVQVSAIVRYEIVGINLEDLR